VQEEGDGYMASRLDECLRRFCEALGERDAPGGQALEELLEEVRRGFGLDVVYVLEALGNRRYYFSHYLGSGSNTACTHNMVELSEAEYAAALREYNGGELCETGPKGLPGGAGRSLQYSFVSGGFYQGAVGFQRGGGAWTGEERDFLKRLGRVVKLCVYAGQLDRQESADSLRSAGALESLYESIVLVNLSTGRYHALRVADWAREQTAVDGVYSESMERYIDSFVEQGYQEAVSYHMSPQYIKRRLAGKERSFYVDYRRPTSGRSRRCRMSCVLLSRSPEGDVEQVLVTVQDLTVQQEELELQDMAFSLMRGGYCRIAYVDLNANLIIFLQALEGEENVGTGDFRKDFQNTCEKYVLPDYQASYRETLSLEHVKDLFDKGAPYLELAYQRLVKGTPTWVRTEVVPLEDYSSQRARTMWYVRNISQEKGVEDWYQKQLLETNAELRQALDNEKALREQDLQARLALKDAYQLANHASIAKSDFLSRMSHDIRTPMNAIIGMTAIAGAHLNDPDRVEDCLAKITSSSRHLLSLINEVLDMSKIESGKLDLNEEPFCLSELVDDLVSMVRPQVETKGHALRIQIQNVEHERVIGDSVRLQQSFLNLLSNAVKYTPPGGQIDLIITEKPCRQPQFGCYEFVFQDNGIGMDAKFVERIFEPFSRAKQAEMERVEGTGLGMAITSNLIRLMNGTIQVKSRLGKGSRFTVTLFLRRQAEDMDQSCDALVDLPVLVADDDQFTCEAACGILDDLGMNSEWVLSGREAVEKVKSRHEAQEDYFAVVLDWKMPDMDGLATTKAIRSAVGPDMPIIIISAYDWSVIEQEAKAAGVNAFISKPFFKSRFAYLFRDLAHQDQEEAQAEQTPMEALAGRDFTGRRILLAEDNDLNAEIAIEILRMAKLTVERAVHGQEAVEMFRRSAPGYYDLIFMDIQMPRMDGYEATRAIRAMDRPDAGSVPIVAMTANAFTEDAQKAAASGMNGHLPKPLDLKQLENVLHQWLGPVTVEGAAQL